MMMINRTCYRPLRVALVICSIVVVAMMRADAFNVQPSTSVSRVQSMGMEQNAQQTEAKDYLSRRKAIGQLSTLVLCPIMAGSTPALASDEAYVRTSPNDKFKFSYTVTPPPLFEPGNKPLKTHLDEINFSIPDVRGYTLGVTVDPVRISSIKEFGTPEEVAARVVTAEVNRDGVFEVTLAKDPVEDNAGCYDIEYISDGKRGKKRFATRIYIKDGFLYVLTVQSKEAEFDEAREKEVQACIKSFRPL